MLFGVQCVLIVDCLLIVVLVRAVRSHLCVVRCSSFVVCCLVSVVCGLLSVGCCSVCVFVVRCASVVDRWLLLVIVYFAAVPRVSFVV